MSKPTVRVSQHQRMAGNGRKQMLANNRLMLAMDRKLQSQRKRMLAYLKTPEGKKMGEELEYNDLRNEAKRLFGMSLTTSGGYYYLYDAKTGRKGIFTDIKQVKKQLESEYTKP